MCEEDGKRSIVKIPVISMYSMMQTGIHIDSGYFLTEFADFLRNMFQFLF